MTDDEDVEELFQPRSKGQQSDGGADAVQTGGEDGSADAKADDKEKPTVPSAFDDDDDDDDFMIAATATKNKKGGSTSKAVLAFDDDDDDEDGLDWLK